MIGNSSSCTKNDVDPKNNSPRRLAMAADRLQLLTRCVGKDKFERGWKRHTISMRPTIPLVKLFQIQKTSKMAAHGYEWGEAGLRSFAETYGVLERVTTIEPVDNSCSKARVTKQIKRKPGASPLLFGEFLMSLLPSFRWTTFHPSYLLTPKR